MKKLFISCPMKGRTTENIKASMEKMHKLAELFIGEPLEVIDSYFEHEPVFEEGTPDVQKRMWFLGESIKKLGEADVFIGWRFDGYGYTAYPGCNVEFAAAHEYGIKCIDIPHYMMIGMMPDVHEILNRNVSAVCG